DADSLAASDQEIDALEQNTTTTPCREAFCVEDDVPRARRWGETEADTFGDGPDVFGSIDLLELVEHLASTLRLLRLLSRDVATNEVFGLVDERSLPFGERPLTFQIIGACRCIVGVAKRINAQPL